MIPDPPGSEIVTPSGEPIDSGKPSAVPKAWRRLPLPVRRALMSGGAAVGAVALVYAALAGNTPPRVAAPKPASVVKLAAVRPAAGPAREEREALVESVVRSQKKRIMGRKRSLPDVERVATRVGPLVARALEQPSIQADLRALAEQNGMSPAEYKQYFRRKQEADLLLESGGDPNARSVSNAIGVAQFLDGTDA